MIPKLDEYKAKWNVESDDSIKPGLAAIQNALNHLNNPQNGLNIVHIAGTNGKGSTLAFIENISMEHGLTVGKFTSPCIKDVHDQIQIDGKPIAEIDLDEVFKIMHDAQLSGLLTDFELLTCAALIYFYNKKVDLVLFEAGMGGLEDSTNVVVPIVSIIPSIALEHTKFLGNSIESIARHKAGIIKHERPVIVGKLPIEANKIIEQESENKNSTLYRLGNQFHVQFHNEGDLYVNRMGNIQISGLKRSLIGEHQGENMALAITAFLEVAKFFQMNWDEEKIRKGVKAAKVPGRFEKVMENVYLDGAHNPASAEKLAQTIKQQIPNEPIRFVIGMLADKDVKSVLKILETVSDEFYFINFMNSRAMKAEEMINLSNATEKYVINDFSAFIKGANFKECKTIVTGSLYLLTELRSKIFGD
ncbi:folylpolyglutamate synthase [Ureibacillus massiliensis 4400831 = CIP 108448 = CCUG 49529]|uniref:tetrahydrofolate synthase n=1 Tax=Ureibacillus massiliensis 4400831 = CIP 108448 = CCUG 49529 TaxID=1211035 RepID=A0A0A3JTW1_9BACL|nr:folylpolyglutamate synthase/dihydrofolate synthase family protein [Ureibacillus massiliensis]KGR90437.1 folylpolyglutamate synthase [Ureibacillus massiliensis 4400831 = CIP 108448 = CCUG 49529]